ncbi:MAG: DUF1553 domain-containing protein, partial [Planctomycetota bacterium]
EFFDVFNRPERQAVCDCESLPDPTLRQAMLLMSSDRLTKRVEAAARRLFDSTQNDSSIAESVFLRVLCRMPTEDEQQAVKDHFQRWDGPSAMADILWALINTREFVTLH